MDYHALNKVTIKLRCPLPRLDDLLDDLGGAKNSTNLDVLSGYYQIWIREKDVKTALCTPLGQSRSKSSVLG
jgi:hypothetical protein